MEEFVSVISCRLKITTIISNPGLSVAWRLQNDFALKGSYATMHQFVHMISNTGISLPTDLWVPTTDRIKPQQSQQVAIGFVKDFSQT